MKALEELEAAPVHSFNEEGEVFQNVYFQEHLFYINNGEFEKAEALIPAIKEGLEKYATKINKARFLSFQYNIFVMYFLMHQFKEALHWAESLLEDKSEIKQSWKNVTLLLLPIIHFELGHIDLIENYTRSAYRYLKSKNRLHDFDKAILKFLKHMPLNSGQPDFIDKVTEFNQQLVEISTNPRLASSVGVEEFTLWTRTYLEDKKMTQMLLESSGSVE